jgi:predicted nucleotidyltransferase
MTIELAATTGNQAVDSAVLAIVGLFEAAFPERLRGVYVEGSYADDSAVATSDVGLIVLFISDSNLVEDEDDEL